MRLRSFFSFYGAKWRIAPRYPKPKHDTIIEPFAGAAGYSVFHSDKKVILYDVDPIIAGVWEYLIKATSEEVMKIPVDLDHVDDLIGFPQETKWLVGFLMNAGCAAPCKIPSAWMKKVGGVRFWGKEKRAIIASQVEMIKHWKVYNKSYSDCEQKMATWFIDPPYRVSGKFYNFSEIDYDHLGEFCHSRKGQIIVCENEGADWLPFVPFHTSLGCGGSGRKGKKGVSREVIWEGKGEG